MRGTLLALILLAAPAVAAPQEVDLFVQRCRAGELPACNVAGLIFQTGAGEDADLSRAMDFYRLACAGGDATGCTSIGLMYETGRGTEPDPEVAASQYRLGCDRGSGLACDLLEDIATGGPITERRRFFKAGRVIDARTGAPLEGVLVAVPGLALQVMAGPGGDVELGRIPEGTYPVTGELLGYERVSGVMNVPGYAEFVLLMERIPGLETARRGQVMGVVTDGRRRGLADVTVVVVEQEGLRVTTDHEGRFVLPTLSPGLWTVRITGPGGRSKEARLVVQPGRAARLDATVTDEGIRLERPF